MTQPKTILETEWSYFVNIDDLKPGENTMSLSPDEEAKKRLAQRLGIVSLDSLKADVVISNEKGASAYHVRGQIEADITQSCVVSLEPVKNHIQDNFEAWYADPEGAISIAKARHEKLTEKGHGEQPILDEQDDPEPLVNGSIDLGELITQYLSLGIDPYPHAEGVEYEVQDDKKTVEPDAVGKNPFAALQDWKDKITSGEDP